jgi:hypothetical protein
LFGFVVAFGVFGVSVECAFSTRAFVPGGFSREVWGYTTGIIIWIRLGSGILCFVAGFVTLFVLSVSEGVIKLSKVSRISYVSEAID